MTKVTQGRKLITQNQLILKRLRRGWLTGLQALHECGTMKLATRVGEIRESLIGTDQIIISKWVENNGKRFKAYRVILSCNSHGVRL